MNHLILWWADTLGWEGTRELSLVILCGIGIAATSWSLGADHARKKAHRQHRNIWRGQRILK